MTDERSDRAASGTDNVPHPVSSATSTRTMAGLGPVAPRAPSSSPASSDTLLGLGVIEDEVERPRREAGKMWQSVRDELSVLLDGALAPSSAPRPLATPVPTSPSAVRPPIATDLRRPAPATIPTDPPRRGWPRTPARMARRAAPDPVRAAVGPARRAPWLDWVHPIAWVCVVVAALALGFGVGRL